MKKLIQNLNSGETLVFETPTPVAERSKILIQSSQSVVSPGTERMLQQFGKAGYLEKARQQPDKVRQTLEKLRTDGLATTVDTVRDKLDQPIPLGYCNTGTVLEVGEGVTGFNVGDRVASNGPHAEIVNVAQNLCAKVPDEVSDESAAFTVLGAVALQGIRLAQPTMGECVVVTGLGLVGLITVQLLRAQGCRVLGIDPDPSRVALARQFGAEVVDLSAGDDPLQVAHSLSRGRGVDAVLITASTKSNEPVSQAAKICRKRGRIVLVGVTGLELSRAEFYEKELSFQVSCSYGPGRYDPEYEDKGHDYPVGYVRWTEQRNMEAVLDMMATGALDVAPLISHRFAFDDALDAYELLGSDEPSLGILLEYSGKASMEEHSAVVLNEPVAARAGEPVLGFIGAGNYAGRVLMPAFRKAGGRLRSVVSGSGLSGVHQGKKHGFEQVVGDAREVFEDEAINAVVIATRHDSHAGFVVEALGAGKHVFVEKPLGLSIEEVEGVGLAIRDLVIAPKKASADSDAVAVGPLLMVGFNRRFAPQVQKIKELLEGAGGPSGFVMTVNAGAIAADHWTQDPEVGGGRIVGEACHFVDLLRFLAGAAIESHHVSWMRPGQGVDLKDNATISLNFADGSVGTIHYLANGSRKFPKERLEVFNGGRILQLDNFRSLKGFGWPGFKKMNLRKQDKGQSACAAAFLEAIREGRPSPIPLDEILEVSRVSIEIADYR